MGRSLNFVRVVKMVEKEEKTLKNEEEKKEEIPEKKEQVPVDVADDDDDEEEEEEELVDPVDALRVSCSQDAESKALLAECTERVEGRSMTEETCQQEQFDFIGHRDHCV